MDKIYEAFRKVVSESKTTKKFKKQGDAQDYAAECEKKGQETSVRSVGGEWVVEITS